MARVHKHVEPHSRVLTSSFRPDLMNCVITFLFILLFVFLSLNRQNPPAAVQANASPDVFSSGRAMGNLKVISRTPHPIGSVEQSEVRDYIMKELSVFALDSEVQQTTAVNQEWEGTVRAGTVHNILARLKGTDNTKAVMVVGHYDSMPASYGASDDGAAVVAMLEVLRALRAGKPLKNDVIFLFTDGEEVGLLGAHAFVAEHPWAKDVGVVLNFEARGNHGPSIMFETSENNGFLIKGFAEATPHPIGHSLGYEIYKLLPNDTDLTVFKKAGFAGLNFAYINGLPHYHTLLDSLANIDERSLQHHGSNMMALTRYFSNLNLRDVRAGNAVYFDILGNALIRYSNAWIIPLTALVTLLFIGVVIVGLRRKRLQLSGIALGFLALLLTMIVCYGVITLIWRLISNWQNVSGSKPMGETYFSGLYLLSFIALVVALVSALYGWFGKKLSMENLTVGALLWWLLLMLLTSFYLPGASYLFTWPLLFSLLALGAWLISAEQKFTPKFLALFLICSVPGIILLSPVIQQTFIALTLTFIGWVVVFVVLAIGLLIPHLNIMTRPSRWLLPGASALASVAFLVAIGLAPGADANHPKLDSLFYGLNADTGKAVWGSIDKSPDEWTSKFLSGDVKAKGLNEFFSPAATAQFLQTEAPVAPLAAPEIALLDDKTSDNVRTLRMQITSPRRATVLSLYVDSPAEMLGAMLNGKQIDKGNAPATMNRRKQWSLRYYAVPAGGIELTMEMRLAEPLRLRVVDQSYGLPEIEGKPFEARPDNIIPATMLYNNTTMVSKTFTF